MAQTAVEWLHEIAKQREPDKFDWEQAKQMENEQIIETWKHGNLPTFLGRVLTAEEYYKETYGK
jgi:hypothetical protein